MRFFQLRLVGKRTGFRAECQWSMGEIRTGKMVAETLDVGCGDLRAALFAGGDFHTGVMVIVDGQFVHWL